jgi:hypothetical protein
VGTGEEEIKGSTAHPGMKKGVTLSLRDSFKPTSRLELETDAARDDGIRFPTISYREWYVIADPRKDQGNMGSDLPVGFDTSFE